MEVALLDNDRPGDERPEILTEQLEWVPEPGIAPLSIDLQEFFGRVFDSNPP